MLIESKIKNGYDSMFYVPQTYFKSAHLLNKMAIVQFQCSRTVRGSSVVGQLIVPKWTFLCFLQPEGTRGVVNDLDNVFEYKKLVLGHKTIKSTILIWYWVYWDGIGMVLGWYWVVLGF